MVYKDLLSFGDFNASDKYLAEGSESYKNAAYVLKANTEYPLEMLDENDLSNVEKYEDFLKILVDDIFLECGRVLKPKKYMCLVGILF